MVHIFQNASEPCLCLAKLQYIYKHMNHESRFKRIPHVLHRAVTFMFGIQVDGKGRKGLQLVYDPVKIFSI